MDLKKHISFICLIGLLCFASCKKTDWKENYRTSSKSPFGTYIVFQEMDSLFPNNKVTYLKKNIYDYLREEDYRIEEDTTNYICVRNNSYFLDQKASEKLLEFVERGNYAFLSLYNFHKILKETLKFETENLNYSIYEIAKLKELQDTLFLKNKNATDIPFFYDRNIRKNYFSSIDSTTTSVLGTQKIKNMQQPNFIKIAYGSGTLFLHTQPITFTNYFLLKGNTKYVEQLFSYLPDNDILWDPLSKKRKYSKEKDTNSVFKFFWKHPPLKWSLYVAFWGLILFLLFNSRRKQRPIPLTQELINSTKDFTHTIANLYRKEENHKNMVAKKITFFLEKIRSMYGLNTAKLDTNFVNRLAAKSGNTINTTKYLINTMIALNNKSDCTQDELIRLNKQIENFFENK